MEEALKRLHEAEASNQQKLEQLRRGLSAYEEEKQEELQQRILELRAASLREQTALEQRLQQQLQETIAGIEEQQLLVDRQETIRRYQEQVVDQIVEGVIQSYGSHETK
jgi:biotin-(acetyl-CoA carboxylase) ligase